MKHVSWIVALILGLAVGFFAREALDGRPGGSRTPVAAAPSAAQAPRPVRPTEDPKAVYRIPVDGSALKGPADALVTIVESSDFQCPFCKRVAPTMKQIQDAYAGKVRFVFKHNPLPNHPQAFPAAMATEEAKAQGGDAKFWAMHDALFEASALDPAGIEAAAAKIGVDGAKVRDAIATRKHEARVTKDQQLVRGLGAGGTPTFFVNGRKVVGALPFESFKTVIDEELKKAEALVRAGTPASQVYDKIVAQGATAPVMLAGAAQPPPQEAAPAGAVYRKVNVRADDPARGAKDAKVTIVLFSDFQCPFCSRVEPTLAQLLEAYPKDVRVVWKHQPLSFHAQALPASVAAEAAREQGKFWPMHDALFEQQKDLSPATYERLAKALGLDVKRFQSSVASGKHDARIKEDQALANAVGANGTPTMFFNCRQVVGALPLDRMRPIVEEELKKADALLKGGKPDAGLYAKACEANVSAAPTAAAAPSAAPVPTGFVPAGAPVKIDVRADDPVRGNPKAPVTIVLFSDFQCPYCARVEPIMKDVERAYGNKVKVVWKHQPLSFHAQALPAAEAAEAAREQGKFWQMHDGLFADQRALSPERYEQVAKEIGLDVSRFKQSIASGRNRTRIQQDQALAMTVGAQGTPTMFINGEKVVGARPLEQLKPIIDRALAQR
jgi:protein-disulfide isomerase